jgi:hypothetical protein
MRLGKLPPKFSVKALRIERYLDLPALPAPPASRIWSAKVSRIGMMLNDQLGCCAIAGPGHQIETWSANNGQEIVVPDSAILKAYEAVGGYRPEHPETDGGCILRDMLDYWRKAGIFGNRILAHADVPLGNRAMTETCINLFGGSIIGVALPLSAQTQEIWTVVRGSASAWAGSWGGHCVDVVDYDPLYISFFSWGKLMKMTWDFFFEYCDENHAVVSSAWAMPGKVAPSGFALPALLADVQRVAA